MPVLLMKKLRLQRDCHLEITELMHQAQVWTCKFMLSAF